MNPNNGAANRSLLPIAAAAIVVVVFVGFARNYYLRIWFGTRHLSLMVHIHGLVMTAWVVLFLTQIGLVAKKRVDLHRKLGIGGAILAAIVVMLGVYTIATSIERQSPGASEQMTAELFVAFDGLSLLLFGGLVAAALSCRRRPVTHKRLMLMALLSLLPPAFGRAVAYLTHDGVELKVLELMYITVLSCVLVDSIRHRRMNAALVCSGVLLIIANQLTYFAQTAT